MPKNPKLLFERNRPEEDSFYGHQSEAFSNKQTKIFSIPSDHDIFESKKLQKFVSITIIKIAINGNFSSSREEHERLVYFK